MPGGNFTQAYDLKLCNLCTFVRFGMRSNLDALHACTTASKTGATGFSCRVVVELTCALRVKSAVDSAVPSKLMELVHTLPTALMQPTAARMLSSSTSRSTRQEGVSTCNNHCGHSALVFLWAKRQVPGSPPPSSWSMTASRHGDGLEHRGCHTALLNKPPAQQLRLPGRG